MCSSSNLLSETIRIRVQTDLVDSKQNKLSFQFRYEHWLKLCCTVMWPKALEPLSLNTLHNYTNALQYSTVNGTYKVERNLSTGNVRSRMKNCNPSLIFSQNKCSLQYCEISLRLDWSKHSSNSSRDQHVTRPFRCVEIWLYDDFHARMLTTCCNQHDPVLSDREVLTRAFDFLSWQIKLSWATVTLFWFVRGWHGYRYRHTPC